MPMLRSWIWLLSRLFNTFDTTSSYVQLQWFLNATPWPTSWLISCWGEGIVNLLSCYKNLICYLLLPNLRSHWFSPSWFVPFLLSLSLLVQIKNSRMIRSCWLSPLIHGKVISSCIFRHPRFKPCWLRMIAEGFNITPNPTVLLMILYIVSVSF